MYLGLGQPQRVMEDFDQAIRLNPELANAYRGRAIANTLLGKDAEAQQNADRAIELRIDPTVLENAIEGLKGNRWLKGYGGRAAVAHPFGARIFSTALVSVSEGSDQAIV